MCPPLAVTKKELVKKVAEDARVEVKIAEAVVAATFDAIVQYVAEGEKVSIVGFGTYEAKTRSARTGRNPQTGEALQIPEKKAPSFTAGKAFKDKVNCESSDK